MLRYRGLCAWRWAHLSVCPVSVHQVRAYTWNMRSPASPIPSYVVLCSKLSVYFLIGIIFFFLMLLRRNQLKLSKSPILKKSPRSEPFSRRSCEQERRAGSGSPRTSRITSVTKREKFKNKSHWCALDKCTLFGFEVLSSIVYFLMVLIIQTWVAYLPFRALNIVTIQ